LDARYRPGRYTPASRRGPNRARRASARAAAFASRGARPVDPPGPGGGRQWRLASRLFPGR
jgi:hypothetical protein